MAKLIKQSDESFILLYDTKEEISAIDRLLKFIPITVLEKALSSYVNDRIRVFFREDSEARQKIFDKATLEQQKISDDAIGYIKEEKKEEKE